MAPFVYGFSPASSPLLRASGSSAEVRPYSSRNVHVPVAMSSGGVQSKPLHERRFRFQQAARDALSAAPVLPALSPHNANSHDAVTTDHVEAVLNAVSAPSRVGRLIPSVDGTAGSDIRARGKDTALAEAAIDWAESLSSSRGVRSKDTRAMADGPISDAVEEWAAISPEDLAKAATLEQTYISIVEKTGGDEGDASLDESPAPEVARQASMEEFAVKSPPITERAVEVEPAEPEVARAETSVPEQVIVEQVVEEQAQAIERSTDEVASGQPVEPEVAEEPAKLEVAPDVTSETPVSQQVLVAEVAEEPPQTIEPPTDDVTGGQLVEPEVAEDVVAESSEETESVVEDAASERAVGVESGPFEGVAEETVEEVLAGAPPPEEVSTQAAGQVSDETQTSEKGTIEETEEEKVGETARKAQDEKTPPVVEAVEQKTEEKPSAVSKTEKKRPAAPKEAKSRKTPGKPKQETESTKKDSESRPRSQSRPVSAPSSTTRLVRDVVSDLTRKKDTAPSAERPTAGGTGPSKKGSSAKSKGFGGAKVSLADLVSSGKIRSLSVNQLRRLCSDQGIPTTGRKSDIVERLVNHVKTTE